MVGLRALQGVGGDEVPESVMKAYTAWVTARKGSYVGGREHTRGVAVEVEGHNKEEEEKDKPKDKPREKPRD